MNRTAPWLSLAVFCALTPGLALASWGRGSTSSSSSKRDDDGKKDAGEKKRGGKEGRGHGSGGNGNGGGGGRGVGQGGGNSGGGNGGGHHADPPDDRHRGRGVGHRDHGNGNGYGHDHDDRDDDADNGGHPATGGVPGNGRDGRDGRHHGDHDDDGDYVVVDHGYSGPRWGWGWGWGGGGASGGYRQDDVRREQRPHHIRVRLLGEASGATSYSAAANQGSLMGSVRVEGPRWGVVLDGRSVAAVNALELRTLGLGSAHLTYALFSGEDGGRLRLEAGATTLFSRDLIATGPSFGASAELPVFLGLGLEGAVHATAFPFVSASWSAGGFARLGALSLHAGVRRLYVEPTSAGAGPYVALALTFG